MFPEEDSNLVSGHLQNLCVGHEKNPVVLSMLSDGNLWQMRASTCDDKPLATVDKKQVSTDNWQLEICFNEQCKKCKGKKSQGSSTSLESKLENGALPSDLMPLLGITQKFPFLASHAIHCRPNPRQQKQHATMCCT